MSDWLVDERGRRYRMCGPHMIEYEETIVINGLEIPIGQLDDYHRNRREAERARLEAEKNAPPPPPRRNCPFADDNANDTACSREKCALFDGEACGFAGYTPARNTDGLRCPFNRFGRGCRKDCALYDGSGCTITGIIKTNKESGVNI